MSDGADGRGTRDRRARAVAKDHRDYFPLVAGQGVGLINNLPTAAEVMEMIIGEAQAVLQEGLSRNVTLKE